MKSLSGYADNNPRFPTFTLLQQWQNLQYNVKKLQDLAVCGAFPAANGTVHAGPSAVGLIQFFTGAKTVTGNDLASMYEFSYFAINRNLNDLTHEDSVFIPAPSGNCINWVLGHIISARGMMLLLTGAGTPVFSEAAAVFQRGSAAMKSGDQ